VFDDPGIVKIRNAVGTGRAEVYLDAVCEEELVRVLARGFAKRSLDAKAQADCLAQCRRLAQRIDAPAPEAVRAGLPRCGDPDDQKFLEAALAAGADYLVTKDRKLLQLARKKGVPFRIVTPAELGGL
jgi:predicted nucleic acid-binding protein